MPIYNYKCLSCGEKFESIEKSDTEISYCLLCKKLAKRLHGTEIPSPPKLIAGIGGFHSPSYGNRKYE